MTILNDHYASLSPAMKARTDAQLDKQFRFQTETQGTKVMPLRDWLQHQSNCGMLSGKAMSDNSHKYNRRKFNNMGYAEQRAYERRLGEGRSYWVKRMVPNPTQKGDTFEIQTEVAKLVYDVLDLPLCGRSLDHPIRVAAARAKAQVQTQGEAA